MMVDVTDPIPRLQKSIETEPIDFLINFRKLVDKKVRGEKPQRVLIDDLMAFFTAIEYALRDEVSCRRPLRQPEVHRSYGDDHHRRSLRHDPDHRVRGGLLHHPQEGEDRKQHVQIDLHHEDERFEDLQQHKGP